jgi:hypothetical protein
VGIHGHVVPADELVPVWEDNLPVVELFRSAMTQWNYAAMGGRTGLRYESLPLLMRVQGIPRAEQAEVVEWLQVMEVHVITTASRK